jgi:Na+/proline symporter
MSSTLALSILVGYFALLIAVALYTSRGADTNTFFTANKQSPWYLVAFGMIGTSISGVTFISVPGAVGKNMFSYYQVIMGNLLGYFVIATILMPLYYRLNLISIYTYLDKRFGYWSHKSGSFFFLLSRTLGSAARLFLAVQVLYLAIFQSLGVPFWLTGFITIALIWVYTFKGGVKTIIITDTLQTVFLLTALLATIYLISSQLNLSFGQLYTTISTSKYAQVFFFDDINYQHHFLKDFLSGVFIAIVMTGLDQDLMQKQLTCKNIGEAQKNMFWFCCTFAFVVMLFLCLGALLYIYAGQANFPIPTKTDELYPSLALGGHFGTLVAVTFLLGITAATYASSDSALTALTTSFCIDFMNIEQYPEIKRNRIKHYTHLGFSVLFLIIILGFRALSQTDVLDIVFKIAGFTYGPLLGLFGFGMIFKKQVRDPLVPWVCAASPFITYYVDIFAKDNLGFEFGFTKLMLNGLITMLGLWAISNNKPQTIVE